MPLTKEIEQKLALLPDGPGCYLMKDGEGNILYVGKAKILKNRVRSYFHGEHNHKTTKLVENIQDFEFIRTWTEKDALLLEINLIKKHHPPFNIVFMDDKMYPYIEVTRGADFAIRITRKATNKDSAIFGPYPVSTYAYDAVKLLNQLFPSRKCRKPKNAPCLYYHMHQCRGFCFQEVDTQAALEDREKVIRFLKGSRGEIKAELEEKMQEASEKMEFERAGEILKQIKAIEHIQQKQAIDFEAHQSFDAFGFYADKGYISIQGLFVREGKLLERNMSISPIYEDPEEVFLTYLVQYYKDSYQNDKLPKTIYVPQGTDIELLQETLDTHFQIPKQGERLKLLQLAQENAKEAHNQKFQLAYRRDQDLQAANEKLSEIFQKPIHMVELIDNSHLTGSYNVSALVSFKEGKPFKSGYRHYNLSDHYRSDIDTMKEVLKARYGKATSRPLPDLLIVDGGLPQVQAALEVKRELNIPLSIAGLVKDDHHSTRAFINEDLQEVPLDKTDPLFFLLARMQDEVHRFAITYHQKLRNKGMTKSLLDDIPGLGPARKAKLRKAYPSLKKMKKASVEELSALVPESVAKALYEKLREQEIRKRQNALPKEEG